MLALRLDLIPEKLWKQINCSADSVTICNTRWVGGTRYWTEHKSNINVNAI